MLSLCYIIMYILYIDLDKVKSNSVIFLKVIFFEGQFFGEVKFF